MEKVGQTTFWRELHPARAGSPWHDQPGAAGRL